MKIYTHTLTLISLLSPITSNGESMIGNFLKKLQNPAEDISLNNPGISKAGSGGLFVYKLNKTPPVDVNNTKPTYTPMTASEIETGKIAIEQQKQEMANREENNAKEIIYGDQGVLANPHVIEAWKVADEAKKRLQNHREYMNQVRDSRKNISSKKSLTK